MNICGVQKIWSEEIVILWTWKVLKFWEFYISIWNFCGNPDGGNYRNLEHFNRSDPSTSGDCVLQRCYFSCFCRNSYFLANIFPLNFGNFVQKVVQNHVISWIFFGQGVASLVPSYADMCFNSGRTSIQSCTFYVGDRWTPEHAPKHGGPDTSDWRMLYIWWTVKRHDISELLPGSSALMELPGTVWYFNYNGVLEFKRKDH